MRRFLASVFIAGLLTGCASGPNGSVTLPPINNVAANPVATVAAIPDIGTWFKNDVTSWQIDMDSAVAAGLLPATDPNKQCADTVAGMLATPAGQSFTPQVSGILSAAAVGYIVVHQLQTLIGQGGIVASLPPSCTQTIGSMVITGIQIQTLMNAGLLNGIIGAAVLAPK
jgi:hypothetical protein